MKLSISLLASVLSFTILWLGCSDEPNAVGLGILPPQDSLHIDSAVVSATSDVTFLKRIRSTATTLLLGRDQGLEGRTMLYFAGLSSIPATATLDSATLSLRVNYRFKDSSGTLGFEVRKMKTSFLQNTYTWDSLAVPGAFSDTVSGTFLKNITPLDSTLIARVDTTLIRQFMLSDNGSVVLLPSANIVVGVVNNLATLKVYYHNGDTTARTSSFLPTVGAYVADGSIPATPSSIILQAGLVQRGIVRFDSLAIPRQASITQAFLEVAIDTTSSLTNSYSNKTLLAFLLRGTTAPYDSVALGTVCTQSYRGNQLIFRANVKSIVQQWLTREPNYGIVLRTAGEFTSFDRFVLHSSSAPAGLRPRLNITYTLLP